MPSSRQTKTRSTNKNTAKTSANNVIRLAGGSASKQIIKSDYVFPDYSKQVIDSIFGTSDVEDLKNSVRALFRAANKHAPSKAKRQALAKKLKRFEQRLDALHKARLKTDCFRSVLSSEQITPANKFIRASGYVFLALGLSLVVASPIIASIAISNSDLLDSVSDNPSLGLLYGIAPLVGIAGGHLIHENLEGDSTKRKFHIGIGITTVLNLGLWGYIFPAVFLGDVSQGFPKTVSSLLNLQNWYRAHIALEFLGGLSVYSLVNHFLTQGAKTVFVPNEVNALFDTEEKALGKQLEEAHDEISSLEDTDERFIAASDSHVKNVEINYGAVKEAVADLRTRNEAVSRAEITEVFYLVNKDANNV